jgi:hypothetical protein
MAGCVDHSGLGATTIWTVHFKLRELESGISTKTHIWGYAVEKTQYMGIWRSPV